MTQDPKVIDRVFECAVAAAQKKGANIVALDVGGLTGFTDYMLVVSASSDRRVRTIAEAVKARMKEEGLLPIGVEGLKEGKWALIDFGAFVVHVFYEELRGVFDLEGLWSDSKRLELPPEVAEAGRSAQGEP